MSKERVYETHCPGCGSFVEVREVRNKTRSKITITFYFVRRGPKEEASSEGNVRSEHLLPRVHA